MAKTKSKRPKRAADGLYHVRAYIGRREDGSRYYKRFENPDWNDLQIEIATFKKAFASGQIPEEETRKQSEEPPRKEPTLLDAIDMYIDTCRAMMEQNPKSYSPTTIASYASYRRSIGKYRQFAHIANAPVSTLTVAGIQEAINNMARPLPGEKKLSSKTIQNWFGVIKPAIDAYGPDIRLDKVKKAKNSTKKAIVFREKDIPQILRIAREIGDEFFLYILFTAILGMRQSESYALRWGDFSDKPLISIEDGTPKLFGTVNIDKACVKDELGVYREKGAKTEAGQRSLSRPWSFFEMLYSVKPRGKDDERIFSLQPNLLPYRWKKLKKKIVLPDTMVMYDLRHYHATVMDALGASPNYIAGDMGHSDVSITRKHYIEELDTKRQEINSAMYAHTDNLISLIDSKCDAPNHAPDCAESV